MGWVFSFQSEDRGSKRKAAAATAADIITRPHENGFCANLPRDHEKLGQRCYGERPNAGVASHHHVREF